MMITTTRTDAHYVHDEWDRRTRAHDVDALLDLYTHDAVLESPLVPRIMDSTSGVLRGHEPLREFFERGARGRPNELVRFYRTGRFLFQNGLLVWEYPRHTTRRSGGRHWGDVDLAGPKITHHRIYWGWFAALLLQPSRT